MKRRKPKLTKPWKLGHTRPWKHLPWWEWKWFFQFHPFALRIIKVGPVTDAELRQILKDAKWAPPEHFNCRCIVEPLE